MFQLLYAYTFILFAHYFKKELKDTLALFVVKVDEFTQTVEKKTSYSYHLLLHCMLKVFQVDLFHQLPLAVKIKDYFNK